MILQLIPYIKHISPISIGLDIFVIIATLTALKYAYQELVVPLIQLITKKSKEDQKDINLQERVEKLEVLQEDDACKTKEDIEFLKNSINILIESDLDNIKAYLSDKHHYYCQKKWIDNYNLDCIERRYVHYKKYGGNSFVDHLMMELRDLPTEPPEKD